MFKSHRRIYSKRFTDVHTLVCGSSHILQPEWDVSREHEKGSVTGRGTSVGYKTKDSGV